MTLAVTVSRKIGLRASLLTDAALILLGSLFVAALAQARIYLPFTPVPITGQTFAVLLIGAVLGSRRGAAAIGLYIAEGALGLPFFAGGNAGWAALAGPTGGYLIGFIAAAFLVGLLTERGLDRRFRTALPAFLTGSGGDLRLRVAWAGALRRPPERLRRGCRTLRHRRRAQGRAGRLAPPRRLEVCTGLRTSRIFDRIVGAHCCAPMHRFWNKTAS